MFFKKDSSTGVLFYRVNPWVGLTESFEYSQNWSGTISNPDYPDTFTGFSSPDASIAEQFEVSDGW